MLQPNDKTDPIRVAWLLLNGYRMILPGDLELLAQGVVGPAPKGWLRKDIGPTGGGCVPGRLAEELLSLGEKTYRILGSRNTDSVLRAMAFFHLRFLELRPLSDGNGRVARAILAAQCAEWCQLDAGQVLDALFGQSARYVAMRGALIGEERFALLVEWLAELAGRDRASVPRDLPYPIEPDFPASRELVFREFTRRQSSYLEGPSSDLRPPPPGRRSFLVIASDRIAASALMQAVRVAWPDADWTAVHDAAAGVAEVDRASPDLVVADAHTEDRDGLDYIPELMAGARRPKLIVVTYRRDERTLRLIRQLPPDGWIDGDSDGIDGLKRALARLEFGRRYVSPAIEDAWERLRGSATSLRLSQREELMLCLIGSGLDNEEAGRRAGISSETVRTHRAQIMRKLGVHRQVDLMVYAMSRGYIRPTADGFLFPGFEDACSGGSKADESLGVAS